jgi:hypothetical protein
MHQRCSIKNYRSFPACTGSRRSQIFKANLITEEEHREIEETWKAIIVPEQSKADGIINHQLSK